MIELELRTAMRCNMCYMHIRFASMQRPCLQNTYWLFMALFFVLAVPASQFLFSMPSLFFVRFLNPFFFSFSLIYLAFSVFFAIVFVPQ